MKIYPLYTGIWYILCILFSINIQAQSPPLDWHLLHPEKDNYPGIALKEAYELLEKHNLTPTPVIVAILDSGIDIEHEDLQEHIWINTDEIPNNGIDDDNNGYIDDINGWNFIGNSNGESLIGANLELTRVYKKYIEQFNDKNKYTILPKDKEDFAQYLILKLKYQREFNQHKNKLEDINSYYVYYNSLIEPFQKIIGKDFFNSKELKKQKLKGKELKRDREELLNLVKALNFNDVEDFIIKTKTLKESSLNLQKKLRYKFDLKLDDRKIVGDDINNPYEKYYGNPDVTKRAQHGTHVAGIIGATRNNNIGINGISDSSILLPIRTVPIGDETDKDMANGIRYAVDNGAQIINMSFGKEYSPNKKIVDEAIQYAASKGVLLIHAAGNKKTDTDLYPNYPSQLYNDGTIAQNWIEVGSNSFRVGRNLIAKTSNYGKMNVDIFAPGDNIYSTYPNDTYFSNNGTSMAAPVVSGIAALLKSYFPELSLLEIKDIILTSGTPYKVNVSIPGKKTVQPFSDFSKTGKIVNAYKAVELALRRTNRLQ